MNNIKSQTLKESLFQINNDICLGEGVTQPWAGEVHRSHLSLYQFYNSSSRPNSRIHYNKQRFFEQYWHIQRNVEMWNTLSAPMSCKTLLCISGSAAIIRGIDERHKCFSFRRQLSLKNLKTWSLDMVLIPDHSSYLSQPHSRRYFFRAGVPFSLETAKFWPAFVHFD